MGMRNKLYLRIPWCLEISAEGPFAVTVTFAIMLLLVVIWTVS
jgi:hypothetical protein